MEEIDYIAEFNKLAIQSYRDKIFDDIGKAYVHLGEDRFEALAAQLICVLRNWREIFKKKS